MKKGTKGGVFIMRET